MRPQHSETAACPLPRLRTRRRVGGKAGQVRDLLTATVYVGRGEATKSEPMTVRALDQGGHQEVTVKLGYEPTLHLSMDEADHLAAMLSNATEAIWEEVTR